jgi:hypothetical protein
MDINHRVVIELDEQDAGLLVGHLAELTGRLPSTLRSRSPWRRIYKQVIQGLARDEVGYQTIVWHERI